MLLLENYDVKLIRLTDDKIEMVRKWRNDSSIQRFMEYRDKITPLMQEKWFKSVDNSSNFYFIINFQNTDIGVINIKNIDSEKDEGEAGVFVYDDKYLNTDVAYRAHLVLFDYFFIEMGLKKISSHVLSDNKRAIRFTAFLGFVKCENQEAFYNQEYNLIKEDYLKNINRLRFIKKWNVLNNNNIL